MLDSQVVSRQLFYRNSPRYDVTNANFPSFSDDNAIATDKTAYLPGSGIATFANVTNFDQGINGIMVDILGSHPHITASDFTFKVGNNNGPDTWAAGPAPTSVTVRAGAGSVSGSERVELIWGANAPTNTWLEVTVLSTADTGLAVDDHFFFGNAVAITGADNSATQALSGISNLSDLINHGTNFKYNIPITNIYDFNKDGQVGTSDLSDAINHGMTSKAAFNFINVGTIGASSAMTPSSVTTSSVATPSAASGDAATASAVADSSASPIPSPAPAIATWIVSRLGQLDLNDGPLAKYFEHLAHENTSQAASILIAADEVADSLGLDDHLLDALLARLQLE